MTGRGLDLSLQHGSLPLISISGESDLNDFCRKAKESGGGEGEGRTLFMMNVEIDD